MGILRLALLFAVVLENAPQALAQQHWLEYRDVHGSRIEYPADIFSVRSRAERGEIFTRRDGRARIHMYTLPNPKGLSPREFMRTQFPAPRSILTYDRVALNFFALSTRRAGAIVYMRCNFSQVRGGTLHCVEIRYPESEKTAWDGIVTRISRSVRPLP